MKSTRGLSAAIVLLLAVPLAIAWALAFGSGAETIIHFGIGTGSILLALAVFDFGLPTWLNRVGAAAAGAFGSIFLLQGVSDLVPNDGLRYVAIQVFGQQIERGLPDVFFVWLVALLLVASQGRTRILGWAIMPVVIGLEVANLGGPLLGLEVPFVKLLLLLPFVWLLLESAKRQPHAATVEAPRRHHAMERLSA